MDIEIGIADYHAPADGQAIVALMDSYAQDPMGGGQTLPNKVRENLVTILAEIPHAFTVLAYVDGEAAGLVNCFQGFSTFKCRPLTNIHDVVVRDKYRGMGLSQKMLAKVEEVARGRGCCKLTLEVLEGNQVAQSAYRKFGFAGYELDPAMGKALFWEMPL